MCGRSCAAVRSGWGRTYRYRHQHHKCQAQPRPRHEEKGFCPSPARTFPALLWLWETSSSAVGYPRHGTSGMQRASSTVLGGWFGKTGPPRPCEARRARVMLEQPRHTTHMAADSVRAVWAAAPAHGLRRAVQVPGQSTGFTNPAQHVPLHRRPPRRGRRADAGGDGAGCLWQGAFTVAGCCPGRRASGGATLRVSMAGRCAQSLCALCKGPGAGPGVAGGEMLLDVCVGVVEWSGSRLTSRPYDLPPRRLQLAAKHWYGPEDKRAAYSAEVRDCPSIGQQTARHPHALAPPADHRQHLWRAEKGRLPAPAHHHPRVHALSRELSLAALCRRLGLGRPPPPHCPHGQREVSRAAFCLACA